ncbi:MAG: phenylalanine--tRNA ligase subunit alpha, partial [Oscillospiraceae bacterium]|nr:phenylalanine--tRNA ligase subunit alpha [Oscillospiraceae bacterium]
MKELMQKLREASIKAISESDTPESLESLRVKYLGKKGELTGILRQMGKLSPEERPAMGQLANQLRSEIEEAIELRKTMLSKVMLEKKLEAEAVDVTLPGVKRKLGHKHPMYNVLDQIKDIFIGMGFEIVDGPEVELSDYNFTKLNIDEGHPSRDWTDTFYFTEDGKICLRT